MRIKPPVGQMCTNAKDSLGTCTKVTIYKGKCPPQAPKIRFDKMIVWKLPAAGAEIFRLWARFPAGNVISIKAGGGKMSKFSSALPGRSHILPNSISHIAIATPPTIRGTPNQSVSIWQMFSPPMYQRLQKHHRNILETIWKQL